MITSGATAAIPVTLTVKASPSAPTTTSMLRSLNPFVSGGVAAAFAFGMFGFRKRRRIQALLLLSISLLGLGMLSGCSSNSGNSTSTFSSQVVINATGGGVTQLTTFELTQP